MNTFAAMQDILDDFLTEAGELLADIDNKLVELERRPQDNALLNDIFRGFHTIKGGAGFLNVNELVALCHRTENIFDQLRNNQLQLDPHIMDVILEATGNVRSMFDCLHTGQQPPAADSLLLGRLDDVIEHRLAAPPPAPAVAAPTPVAVDATPTVTATPAADGEPDWDALYDGLFAEDAAAPQESAVAAAPPAIRSTPAASPAAPMAAPPAAMQAAPRESTIRVDISRLDMVLNLAGEIGLTRNRLNCLRDLVLAGRTEIDTLKGLDEAVGQLDHLVSDLQNAVMKTRMQPIGRLFQKFPRMVRDLARQLGKNVELVLEGEDTEIDKTMIEDLNDPLVHLIRNALDHGVDSPEERRQQGKPERGTVRLSAEQTGDHIVIEIADDGRGMRPDVIRDIAVKKGLIDASTAQSLDERQCRNLIFLPGFSSKEEVSAISGRGVGMDVVKTNIQKLNGRIDIRSVVGEGTTFVIMLPLTLAILPVLMVRLGEQAFAVPLSMVREILPINPDEVQEVCGHATMVVRDEVVPVKSLASLIGWPESTHYAYGVLMQSAETLFILAVDAFIGQDDVVIKPLLDIKPEGVAGATLSGDGAIVLVLDIEALLH